MSELNEKFKIALKHCILNQLDSAQKELSEIFDKETEYLSDVEIIKKAHELEGRISKLNNKKRNRKLTIFILLAHAILIGILLEVPVNNVRIEATVDANEAEITTYSNLNIQLLPLKSLDLVLLDSVEIDGRIEKKLSINSESPVNVEPYFHISKGVTSIDYVRIGDNANVVISTLKNPNPEIIIKLKQGYITGEAMVVDRFEIDCVNMHILDTRCNDDRYLVVGNGSFAFDTERANAQINLILRTQDSESVIKYRPLGHHFIFPSCGTIGEIPKTHLMFQNHKRPAELY